MCLHVYILDPHSLVFVGITMWAQRLDPFLLKMTEAFTSVSGVNVVQVVGRSVNPMNGKNVNPPFPFPHRPSKLCLLFLGYPHNPKIHLQIIHDFLNVIFIV